MMLFDAVVSRKDLKFPVSATTHELGQYDDDQNTAIFLMPMIDMLFELVQEP